MRKILAAFIWMLLFSPEVMAIENDHSDHTDWTAITADGGELSAGNYYLNGDITLTNNLTIPKDATVTLCLNGHKLTGNGDGTVIYISNGVHFTLCDCQEGNEVNKHYYAINENGKYVFTDEETEQYITGGVVTGGTGRMFGNAEGGAVYMDGGGALGDDTGVFTMTGGTIAGNEAAYSGGGVYIYGTFIMSGNAQIVGNTTGSGGGGGVCLASSDAVFTMNDNASVCYNHAIGGGGVKVNGSTCTMNDNASISYNTCSEDGAGLFVVGNANTIPPASLTMNGKATVSNNKVSNTEGLGGGICFFIGKTSFTMNDQASVSSNTTGFVGGGVYMYNTVASIKDEASISNNSATYGGGLFIDTETCKIEGGTLENNQATTAGSAVYVNPDGNLEVAKGYIEGTFVKEDETSVMSLSGGYFTEDPSDYISEGCVVQSVSEVHNEITYTYRICKPQEQPSADGLQVTSQTSNSLSIAYTASITEGYGALLFAYAEGVEATEPTSEWVNASTDTGTPTVTFNNLKEGTAYTIFIRFAGNETYIQSEKSSKTFTTKSKATPTFNEWIVEGKTYDGDPIVIIPPTLTGIEGVEVTGNVVLSYQKDNAPLEAAPTDAGIYTVIATYPGDENYKSVVSEPVAFTIERAQLDEDIIHIDGEPNVSLDLEVGSTEVTAIVESEIDLSGGTWAWKSSDESVATVTPKEQPITRATFTSRSTATVTAVGIGTTTITAAYTTTNYMGTVSYTLTVAKAEEPATPVIPDMPEYYNIVVDECEGVTVETSSTVVREGQSMTFTIDVAEGYTDEDMTVKVKRSLFGYIEVIEPNDEGIYEVKNIYTDIYITVDGVEEEEEETPTGMEDVESAKVYTKDGSIYVETPQRVTVSIVSMTGAVVEQAEQIGQKRYDLPRGIYIIGIGEERYKVRN